MLSSHLQAMRAHVSLLIFERAMRTLSLGEVSVGMAREGVKSKGRRYGRRWIICIFSTGRLAGWVSDLSIEIVGMEQGCFSGLWKGEQEL